MIKIKNQIKQIAPASARFSSLKIDTVNTDDIFYDISSIIVSSYNNVNKSINLLLIQRNWLIGKRINDEIRTSRKKDYGKSLIKKLSIFLNKKYGKGFNERNLYFFSDFNKKYPNILNSVSTDSLLSWTHYRILLQVETRKERLWYENEAKNESWSVRILQRNISSQYYHRIISNSNSNTSINNKKGTNRNNAFIKMDYVKDPMILEFLGLEEDNSFLESNLEKAIITHLQKFLMELGKGYAFVARQQRIHTEKQDYFIDLVFYNYILKCFVLIDLKTNKISYQDIGQMDMYIKMYDEFKKEDSDNPTLGIVLTSDTDEDIAKYSILHGHEHLFASKYKLYLPSELELKKEIERQKLFYSIKK